MTTETAGEKVYIYTPAIRSAWRERYGWLMALLLILAVGFALRFYNLQRNSLWFDESYDLQIAYENSFWDTVTYAKPWVIHPPLYFPVLHIWAHLLGIQEFPIRMFALVSGMLNLGLVYYLALRWLSRTIALLATLLLAVSPLQVAWSQNIRPYGWFALITTGSMILALLAVDRPRQTWRWLVYGLIAAFVMYTHYLGFHVIFAQAVFFLLVLWKDWKALLRAGITLALVAASFLPYLTNFLEQASQGNSQFYTNQGVTQLIATFETLTAWFVPASLEFLAGAVFVPLYALGVGWLWQKQRKMAILLVSWGLLPVLTAWLSSLVRPNFAMRYMNFCVPPVIITLACGIWATYEIAGKLQPLRWKSQTLAGLILTVAVALSLLGVVNYNKNYWQQDWRGLVNYIVQNRQTGDLIVLANPFYTAQGPFDYYYVYNLNSPGQLERYSPPDEPQNLPKLLASKFQGHPRVWMVDFYEAYTVGWVDKNIYPNLPPGYKQTYKKEYTSTDQGTVALVLLVKENKS